MGLDTMIASVPLVMGLCPQYIEPNTGWEEKESCLEGRGGAGESVIGGKGRGYQI